MTEEDALVQHQREPQSREPDRYTITVTGHLDEDWVDWFEGAVDLDPVRYANRQGVPVTILTGFFADQAALRGLLCRIWDLNLTLVGAVRVKR
jgi:hypothetical protein